LARFRCEKNSLAAPQRDGLFAARSRHHRPPALMSFASVGMRSTKPTDVRHGAAGWSTSRPCCLQCGASLRIGTQRVAVCRNGSSWSRTPPPAIINSRAQRAAARQHRAHTGALRPSTTDHPATSLGPR
jgi:hypothetical protein